MSDANVETTVVETAKKTPVRKDLGDGRYVEQKTFSGKLEDFNYYILQFKNLDAARAHFTRDGKNGDELVLGFVNSSVAYSMRAKAQNKIPNDDDARNKLRAKEDTLVISEEEASAYMPGERDITSLSGLQKLISEKKKQYQAAKEANDTATQESLKGEIVELHGKLQALVLEGLD